MGYAVQMKAQYPELTFTDDYHFEKLSKITGELVILGLSPWNDFHIFETIDKSEIDACTFYYFSEEQCEKVGDGRSVWRRSYHRFYQTFENGFGRTPACSGKERFGSL